MSSKKIITRCLLCCLALLVVFSLVGCKNGNEDLPTTETEVFTQQLVNRRFYVQQGYPTTADEGIETDWVVTEGNDKHYLVDFAGTYADGTGFPSYIDDCGLVASFSPAGVTNVKYNIYTLKGFFMRATQGDMLIGLLGQSASYNFEFNNLFTDNADRTPRDAFVWSETVEDKEESIRSTTVEHNKINFQRVAYTFTVDGVDWRGMMFITMSAQGGFHVVTLETEASVWDANYPQMEHMLDDFRLLGWESEEK